MNPTRFESVPMGRIHSLPPGLYKGAFTIKTIRLEGAVLIINKPGRFRSVFLLQNRFEGSSPDYATYSMYPETRGRYMFSWKVSYFLGGAEEAEFAAACRRESVSTVSVTEPVCPHSWQSV